MEALCQRAGSSCGACCGIYNRANIGRPAVHELLARRTALLRGVGLTPEAFRAAAAKLKDGEEPPLFPLVRVCPLVGYLNEEQTRVGCLAHPLTTGGPDLRDCGVYDAHICDTFFCPPHGWLSEAEASLVSDICADDPYLYGLVITDVEFLRAVLAGVARLAGTQIEARHLLIEPIREGLHGLFSMKEELAPGSDGLFGAFRPGPNGEDLHRFIDYSALGRGATSPYDEILRCVGADPRSGNDLDALEEEIRRRLQACAAALADAMESRPTDC